MTTKFLEQNSSLCKRRHWSRAQKEQLVAASYEPGVTVSEIARKAKINENQLYRWRKEIGPQASRAEAHFIPVRIAPVKEQPTMAGLIEIARGSGTVRVDRTVDGEALGRVLDALGWR